MKLKIWGEALKSAITRVHNEPIEVISWFICVYLINSKSACEVKGDFDAPLS